MEQWRFNSQFKETEWEKRERWRKLDKKKLEDKNLSEKQDGQNNMDKDSRE